MTRAWPAPATPWRMEQWWRDLLFAHWPVPPGALRPLVPDALPLDTFDGAAWIGVVPFRMTGIRFRGLPPLPGARAFCELNVRTYVTVGGRPGVWFFSLDARSVLAVATARLWFGLPYFYARMRLEDDGARIRYRSRRVGGGGRAFAGAYRPTGDAREPEPDTLEHFLAERYCLYAVDRRGSVRRGEIDHVPWPLQPAEAEIETNTMAPAPLPDRPPILHCARALRARIWPPRRV